MKVMIEVDLDVLNELRAFIKGEINFAVPYLERRRGEISTEYIERKLARLERIWEGIK